jgi:hypothetical protein
MEGAARIELAVSVPFTVNGLEDHADYAPKDGLAFSSDGEWGGDHLDGDAKTKSYDNTSANSKREESHDGDEAVHEYRVVKGVQHIRCTFRKSF